MNARLKRITHDANHKLWEISDIFQEIYRAFRVSGIKTEITPVNSEEFISALEEDFGQEFRKILVLMS